ncbi:MAG: thioredoxin domain-containing protein [Candidatus Electrothrix scaldis]|nr:MAG: thioredoxin domain-containing protein [Candidatus Electrothrix sp. GW3-3]
MKPKTANRLGQEKSPYLLQHASNPVDWYPWGEEAFQRAREENKPVFLSIGYSTCHWCHVMARESFADEEIAALLNAGFISIKVDREERPDIDQMYMAAAMTMNGAGGWPLSVFLLPDGAPFYAATYIPPRAGNGLSGFPDVLQAIRAAWDDHREALAQSATELMGILQKSAIAGGGGTGGKIRTQSNSLTRAVALLAESFDQRYGGFGGAPKFPRPAVFTLLFSSWALENDAQALEMGLATLQAMAGGGIHDHIGGGFHRYAVDQQWRVPHFEKMLYDQAQLAEAYLLATQITGEMQYAEVARRTFHYVLSSLQAPTGGFYAAEDADSEDPYLPGQHGEGAYYLWTEEDIVRSLGSADANIFTYCYGVEFDGNALVDPQQEFTGRNIFYVKHTAAEAAEHFDKGIVQIEDALTRASGKLAAKRQQRQAPHRDGKILVSWNSLMIKALARGSVVLQDPQLLKAARDTANFLRRSLYDSESRTLCRCFCQGEKGGKGQLDDYAFLVAGLLELYHVSQEPQWLQWAIELTETQIRLFWDEQAGGFFDSVVDSLVAIRLKTQYDGAEPAPNSLAVVNLVRLARLTDRKQWLDLAEKTLRNFQEQLQQAPDSLPLMLVAQQEFLEASSFLVIAGRREDAETKEMLEIVHRSWVPGRLLLLADGGENQDFLSKWLPFLETVAMQDDQSTAYVCRDYTCQLPVTDPAELKRMLKEEGGWKDEEVDSTS